MSFTSLELNSLKALPCFAEVIEVLLLEQGMSHTCAKVITASQVFFVKKLHVETANKEVFCSMLAAKQGLSPTIVYHDTMWLVTEFIEGTCLAQSQFSLTTENKIATSLRLMNKLHQLTLHGSDHRLSSLNVNKSILDLVNNADSLFEQQRSIIKQVTKRLSTEINTQLSLSGTSSVFCHGDINYSNVLIDNDNKPWLIDFECAHLAPIEFDLAMFIAINNISADLIDNILASYIRLAPNYRPNIKLLTYYILYSNLLNALWYFEQIIDSNCRAIFQPLMLQQCATFDNVANLYQIKIERLLPLFL
ncbi:MAG: phosphotransferase [Colwellia sp.]